MRNNQFHLRRLTQAKRFHLNAIGLLLAWNVRQHLPPSE
jgi:hypothetical protein